MNDLITGFDRFQFDESQYTAMCAEFSPLIIGTDLSRCERIEQIISGHKKVAAIYFWTMRLNDKEFKIYIGKTNSISLRAQNYTGEFQPHSPNDFKLRIFRSFISEVAPTATLNFYVSKITAHDLTNAEKLAIAKYNPFLNKRQHPSPEAKALLRDAFSLFYRSSFEGVLRNDP